ncbi:hypothetical protein F4809DRAFT_202131 [Biscogniauxia mediterranea]|nr:hypothetical protein F4809DRAFT_202131 [Biscogniauxia mediterranea]
MSAALRILDHARRGYRLFGLFLSSRWAIAHLPSTGLRSDDVCWICDVGDSGWFSLHYMSTLPSQLAYVMDIPCHHYLLLLLPPQLRVVSGTRECGRARARAEQGSNLCRTLQHTASRILFKSLGGMYICALRAIGACRFDSIRPNEKRPSQSITNMIFHAGGRWRAFLAICLALSPDLLRPCRPQGQPWQHST